MSKSENAETLQNMLRYYYETFLKILKNGSYPSGTNGLRVLGV